MMWSTEVRATATSGASTDWPVCLKSPVSKETNRAGDDIDVDAEATPNETASTPAITPNFDLSASIIVMPSETGLRLQLVVSRQVNSIFFWGTSTETIGCG